MKQRIVIKVGSNVLTTSKGALDLERIEKLVTQIAQLHREEIEIILISSGAVASGRSEIIANRKLDAVSQRQLFSAIGQAKLINHYYELFAQEKITCGQVLTTKESLSTRSHYLNQKNCMQVMLDHSVIPIMNENDTISVTELMFTDNDELSGLVAAMMSADALIILSNIDGIFDGDPKDPASKVIRQVQNTQIDLSSFIQDEKSSFGRGGMITKCHIARKVAEESIEVIIANGKTENILLDLIHHRQSTVCTRFLAAEKEISGVKKWIAHSEGFAKGEIHINQGAVEALLGKQAVSLLPIGATHIEGEFHKDDIVKIIDPQGVQIGVGRVRFDSQKAKEMIGLRGKKTLIHYDYLYLD